MLRIFLWEKTLARLGIKELAWSHTVFDYQFVDSWITPAVTIALAGIDRGEYKGYNAFKTEFLGVIPHTEISGGFKTLCCIQNLNLHDWTDTNLDRHRNERWCFCGSYMGPNVYQFLGPVIDSLDRDIDLVWDMPFYPKEDAPINALIMETGKKINSWKEYFKYVMSNLEYVNPNTNMIEPFLNEHIEEITLRYLK
ncbi:MAG: hypothetical protein RSC43_01250 [Clostridia bacterium]